MTTLVRYVQPKLPSPHFLPVLFSFFFQFSIHTLSSVLMWAHRQRFFFPFQSFILRYVFIFSFLLLIPLLVLLLFVSVTICPSFHQHQLSNGFDHYSPASPSYLHSKGGSLGSVPGTAFPFFPPSSPSSSTSCPTRSWSRPASALLPDYLSYCTLGSPMVPSSRVPSWKVCHHLRLDEQHISFRLVYSLFTNASNKFAQPFYFFFLLSSLREKGASFRF